MATTRDMAKFLLAHKGSPGFTTPSTKTYMYRYLEDSSYKILYILYDYNDGSIFRGVIVDHRNPKLGPKHNQKTVKTSKNKDEVFSAIVEHWIKHHDK